ncbi:MAG: hypothetical protein P0107_06395 [Nitrosomonas sp.]|nr:hypothetical protein [Nitrosomonas sp.]
MADPVNFGFQIQEGKTRSNDAELEISGEMFPRLIGGVGYIDNEVIGGTNDGKCSTNVY